ncbi:MAG: hypothetical protein AAGA31_02260, partial [Bacteroidota bacterium]
MKFNQYKLVHTEDLTPILLAFLSEAGFDSFQETEVGLLAFGAAEEHATWLKVLNELKEHFAFTFSSEALEDKN